MLSLHPFRQISTLFFLRCLLFWVLSRFLFLTQTFFFYFFKYWANFSKKSLFSFFVTNILHETMKIILYLALTSLLSLHKSLVPISVLIPVTFVNCGKQNMCVGICVYQEGGGRGSEYQGHPWSMYQNLLFIVSRNWNLWVKTQTYLVQSKY